MYHCNFPNISKHCFEAMMLQTTRTRWWLWVNPQLLPVPIRSFSARFSRYWVCFHKGQIPQHLSTIFRSWTNQCLGGGGGCDDNKNRFASLPPIHWFLSAVVVWALIWIDHMVWKSSATGCGCEEQRWRHVRTSVAEPRSVRRWLHHTGFPSSSFVFIPFPSSFSKIPFPLMEV